VTAARAQQAADQAHLKFDDEKSEFLGILKLWTWLESSRGGHGEHRLSSRKHEQLLRDNFVSPRRVREWRDVFAQLQQVVTEHGWRVNTTPATYEQLHLSMLAGLLGNIGQKATRTTRTSARAASVSTATPARTCRRSPVAGSSPPSWSRRRGSMPAASPTSSRAGSRRSAAIC
jgi:hypothetical protein